MYGASNQLLACAGFSRNQDGRIGRRNFRHLPQHLPQRCRGANDLLKHRRVFDFLSQSDVFVSDPIFREPTIFKVCRRREPPDNLSVVIEHRVAANEEPAILPIFSEQPLLHLEGPSL